MTVLSRVTEKYVACSISLWTVPIPQTASRRQRGRPSWQALFAFLAGGRTRTRGARRQTGQRPPPLGCLPSRLIGGPLSAPPTISRSPRAAEDLRPPRISPSPPLGSFFTTVNPNKFTTNELNGLLPSIIHTSIIHTSTHRVTLNSYDNVYYPRG